MARKKAGFPLTAAGLITALVVLAVGAAPGTLSHFVSSKQTAAVSVSTGQAALTITGTGGSNAGVYPGGPAQLVASRTITNTGDVSLGLGAAYTATGGLASSVLLTVSVQTAACAATAPTAWPADSAYWQGPATRFGGVPTTLAPQAGRTLCVWQSLDPNAPNGTQGQTAAVSLTLTGTQTAP